MALRRSEAVVEAGDGWRLSVDVIEPERPRAAAVLGHAMMVDRRTLDMGRDGLATHLANRDIAVLAADLRGHGRSGPGAREGGRWSFDDLVDHDAPALYRAARARWPGLPLVSVGHSLFGHVSLASAGKHAGGAPERIVTLASNVWMRRCEPSRAIWWRKRALIESSALLVKVTGYVPARRFRMGPCDESADYWWHTVDAVRNNRWISRSGYDYHAAIARVQAPVLAITGAGDRLFCRAPALRRFLSEVPSATVEEVGRASGLPFDPGHMPVVTDERARPVWDRVADFLLDGNPAISP